MRRRFIQDSNTGELREVKPVGAFGHPGTFQVGDLPDIQKDCDRRRHDHAKQQKQDRLNRIIREVEKHESHS
jgi:hypothetical protein